MILKFLTILLLCQLAGEVLVLAAGLPIPGPVIGMVILFAGMAINGAVPHGLGVASAGLLDHLALMFVPAGVGVMAHLPLLAEEYPAIVTSLIASTVLTIAVTAAVVSGLLRWTGKDRKR
jgi:holin-like protein